MNAPLNPEQIQRALSGLSGWRFEGEALQKTFEFGSFPEALSFMLRAGFECQAMDHHPDWSNSYNRVEIRLRTHASDQKVTARDVELARRIQRVSWVG